MSSFSPHTFRLVLSVLIGTAALQVAAAADESQWLLQSKSPTLVSSPQSTASPVSEHPIRTVASSLAIVLGGFLLLSLLLRRPKQAAATANLMESLGEIQVAPKVKLHLVRLGQRLLVLHLSPNSVQRVAEIDDPEEVQRMLGYRGGTNQPPQVDELLRAVETVPNSHGPFERLVA